MNTNNVANLTALGYTYGIGLSQRLSFEFEGNISVQGGKYSTNNASGHYEILSFGSYLVHRESFSLNFYGKAKIGMVLERINIHNEESQVETPTDGVNASAGLGVGYAFPIGNSKGTIELEATILEKNINLYGFGLNVSF
ncbi:MAG: hypothetical protein ACC707_17895 [Thiohalomonadales bacterium]